jgi:hypothetical protein
VLVAKAERTADESRQDDFRVGKGSSKNSNRSAKRSGIDEDSKQDNHAGAQGARAETLLADRKHRDLVGAL